MLALLAKKLEERRVETVEKRYSEGKGFLGKEKLKQVVPGKKPLNTKKSGRNSFRPRILSICPNRRTQALDFYFDCYYKFLDACMKLRKGILDTVFPPGMYKPYVRTHPPPLTT